MVFPAFFPTNDSATLLLVTIDVDLPEDLVARIDELARNRCEFVAEAVRKALRELEVTPNEHDVAQINVVVDELNREAEDVLDYQTFA
jgi:metal-responsive CopG/Arc/MetJ family transcriptional regulator